MHIWYELLCEQPGCQGGEVHGGIEYEGQSDPKSEGRAMRAALRRAEKRGDWRCDWCDVAFTDFAKLHAALTAHFGDLGPELEEDASEADDPDDTIKSPAPVIPSEAIEPPPPPPLEGLADRLEPER
jgi:hypothetical protein